MTKPNTRKLLDDARGKLFNAGVDSNTLKKVFDPLEDALDNKPPPAEVEALLRELPMTDAGNAECLLALHGDTLRYCHIRRKWLIWDGQRWHIDDDGETRRRALQTMRERRKAGSSIDDVEKAKTFYKFILSSENCRKLKDLLESATTLSGLATTIDWYDKSPLLANAGSVTLDLQTGQPRDNVQADYMTMRLGPDYDPAAVCPRWLRFLKEIFDDDQDLIAYIQRAIGYSLTGDMREQKLFLCYGVGANGKSVFLSVLQKLLGDYAAATAFDTFDADRHSAIGNDLAVLKGKRLVVVIESDEDRRLSEARVKKVTGNDVIACRFLYGENFNYRPTYKLWLAMNHKPVIRGTDRGIWRRIQLVPFNRAFEGKKDDRALESKLTRELPGILNWALEGLREWLKQQGLNPPRSVLDATDEYRRESDLVGQWLEACTVSGEQMQIQASDAYKSYKAWCEEYGAKPLNVQTWGRRMADKNFQKGKHSGVVLYKGIGLLQK